MNRDLNDLAAKGQFHEGGVAHRFKNDQAIEVFCKSEGYSFPKVANDGTVTVQVNAWGDRQIIGFTF